MSSKTLLSEELSYARIQALGSAQAAANILAQLQRWKLESIRNGQKKHSPVILQWVNQLIIVIQLALKLGSPLGDILNPVYVLVRKEEHYWNKVKMIEKQFAFQAALVLVIPWVVAAFIADFSLNTITLAGIFLQFFGVLGFYAIFYFNFLRKNKFNELESIKDLLTMTWIRILAGMPLYNSLEDTLSGLPNSEFQKNWQRWLKFTTLESSHDTLQSFQWTYKNQISPNIATMLGTLLHYGSPSRLILEQTIDNLEQERFLVLEQKILEAPTKLALIMCLFFAPAFFLILMGALWPNLKLMMS